VASALGSCGFPMASIRTQQASLLMKPNLPKAQKHQQEGTFVVIVTRTLPNPGLRSFTRMFSFKNCIVLALIFTTTIHVDHNSNVE
jgi:hypothetical protein